MLHPSTKKLIDRLAEMTELGKLDWTEGENGSLVYSTEGYSVCLPDGAQEVVIQSKDGKELERAATDALAGTMSDQGVSYAQIVADMGSEANRYARGTETAISSLLAGMEEPEAAVEEDAAALADDGPEDPGDESAALESEGVASHELTPTPEAEPEPAPEADFDADAEATESVSAEEDISPAPIADLSSESEDAAELEADSEEDAAETEAAAPVEDEVDTESDVTEAVARLADEVNNRPESASFVTGATADAGDFMSEVAEDTSSEVASAEDEAPSTIGLAAATAMGVVASAAGLDQDETDEPEAVEASAEPETTDLVVAETTEDLEEDAPVEEAMSAAPASEPYIPFGLEAGSEAPVSALATETIDAPEPVETSVTTFDAYEGQIEQVDAADVTEADFGATVAPDSALAFGEEAEEQPIETTFEATVEEAKDTPDPTGFVMADDVASESAPETESNSAEDSVDLASTGAEPVIASVADATAAEAPSSEETSSESGASEDSTVDTEPEPVLAAPDAPEVPPATEAPRTYSLSGIGAGFGLGALSAKTEASGIPGPSSVPQPHPEKIIIDATEDVLPEIEGNLDLEKMEAAVSEINFGNKSASEPAEDSRADDDDGDILKPRTRFNPWD